MFYVLHMFLMLYDIYGMVWYTQVELVLVISVLTRKFRQMYNKIDLAVFQDGEEGELKSEDMWTKNSPLLREALGLLWKPQKYRKCPAQHVTDLNVLDTPPLFDLVCVSRKLITCFLWQK